MDLKIYMRIRKRKKDFNYFSHLEKYEVRLLLVSKATNENLESFISNHPTPEINQ